MTVLSGRSLISGSREPIYQILSLLPSGHYFDVGASDGHKSRLMLNASSDSTITAIEPFPQNTKMMEAEFEGDDRVTIISAAVANEPGPKHFAVSSAVKEQTGKFRVGYSSLGHIVERPDTVAEFNFEVPSVRIDDLLGDEVCRFMKIDVQGGEMSVLESAGRAFSEHRIDIVYLEFSGKACEIEFLAERGYILFDTVYLLVPRNGNPDEHHWDVQNGPFKLSNGLTAYHAWPKSLPTTLQSYCEFMHSQKTTLGWTQTDLVCVSPGALAQFLNAAQVAKKPFRTELPRT